MGGSGYKRGKLDEINETRKLRSEGEEKEVEWI